MNNDHANHNDYRMQWNTLNGKCFLDFSDRRVDSFWQKIVMFKTAYFQANLAKKYELENTKLREKLNELDFLRARIKEINSENSLLLESKLEIEEKLMMSEKQFEAVRDLEEQLSHCKRHLESVSAVSNDILLSSSLVTHSY